MQSPTEDPGKVIRVVGMDPSLRNWGIASGTLDLRSMRLDVKGLTLINPVLSKSKQVRQNSLDLESAYQLARTAVDAAKHAHAIFVEVPVGSQSARAMASYGICVGVLGALRAQGIPFYEVTPTEVKMAACGSSTATKQNMISWATTNHPEAAWPTHTIKGQTLCSESKAEHLADAVAAIYAGIGTKEFKQALPMMLFS